MSEIDDAWIDEQLKSVPLPPELLERLRGVTRWGDSEVDHALRAVPTPAGMLQRLHAIGSLTDTDIDDDARHIPLPSDVIPRLRRVMRRQAWRERLARLAVAASLLFVLGGGGWLLVKGLRQPDVELPDPFRNPQFARNATEQPKVPTVKQPVRSGDAGPQIVKSTEKRPVNPPDDSQPSPAPNPNVAVTPVPTPQPDDDPAGGGRGNDDASLTAADVLGNSSLVAQPDLRVARGAMRHGVAAPRVKGYDLVFEFRTGEHPLVHPGDNKALLESRLPIWTDTSSFEFAKRAAAARQLLPASQIRAEDFLAAMDYGFPMPADSRIAIRTAAGPSPLGLPGMSLVQVGVQAGAFDRVRDSGTHLTLVIDASSAMAVADRWTAVRKSLAELAKQLGPQDRMSIVVFNQKALTVLVRGDRVQVASALETLATIEPRGLANLAPALEMAAAVAQKKPGSANADDGLTKRLVLVTDGLGWIDPTAMPRMKELLNKTIAAGVRWQVIDVRPDDVSDSRLDELAAVSHGKVRHAETTRALGRELREALIGRRDVVASAVSMKVTFNPEAVESYRLIGHDPAAGGLLSGPVEGDLRAGEAATGLYEVELKPEGPDTVATVEISWHEPGTEEVRHLKQPIGRLQFAPSWMETPLSLQLAALSAETAAILRGSVFAPTGPRAVDQVLEWADRSNPALQSRESFQELRAVLAAVRPAKAGR